MPSVFDRETIEAFRGLSPREAYERVKDLVYRNGGRSSDDFLDAYEELVEHGILTREELDDLEEGRR